MPSIFDSRNPGQGQADEVLVRRSIEADRTGKRPGPFILIEDAMHSSMNGPNGRLGLLHYIERVVAIALFN